MHTGLVQSVSVFESALSWVLAYGFVHECSHWVAIWLAGGRIRRITLGNRRGRGFTVGPVRVGWVPLGMATEFQASPRSTPWCALAGPLLPLLAWPWTPWPAHVVMGLGALMMLPGFSDGALAFPDAHRLWVRRLHGLSARAERALSVLYNEPHHPVPRKK